MEQSRGRAEGGAVQSLGPLEPRPRVQARTLGHSPGLETQDCPWLGLGVWEGGILSSALSQVKAPNRAGMSHRPQGHRALGLRVEAVTSKCCQYGLMW